MTIDPSQTSTSPDQSSIKVQREIERLLALGYPRDMLHVTEDNKVIVHKSEECDGILELWKEINRTP
jgi:hypothetical protein